MESSKTKRRLRKKLSKEPEPEGNLVDMLAQVNKILKSNPGMLEQVNKCVSGIMANPEIMASITSQVKNTSLTTPTNLD
jgi:hypothetical protein